NVARQRRVDVVVDRRDGREIQFGDVEEAQLEAVTHGNVDEVRRHLAEVVDVLDDVLLRVREQALEAAQHGERQDVVAILLRLDDVAEELVRGVPYDASSVGCCRRGLICHAHSSLDDAKSCISNVTLCLYQIRYESAGGAASTPP